MDNPQDKPGGPYVPMASIDNAVPMTNSTSTVVSSYAAQAVDNAILNIANSKTSIRYWENGSFKNGTPNTGDIISFTDSVTTLGGSATFYPTSNHLSTGTALCSYLSGDSIQPNYRDSSGVYAPGIVTVAGTFKSISQAFGKQAFNGITVAGLPVIGSAGTISIPDGVTVKASFWGISV